MNRVFLALLALATAAAISPVASAQSWDFTYSNPGANIYASGTLNGAEIGNTGEYNITSGTITISGAVSSSGTLFPNPNTPGTTFIAGPQEGPWGDELFPLQNGHDGSYFADDYGLYFTTPQGDAAIWYGDNNLYPGGYSLMYDTWDITYPGTFTISAPEGGAALLYLLLAGAGCLGAIFFRSRNGVGSLRLA